MSAAATVAALILDDALGEPPEALHPTVWMGRAISALEPLALKLQTAAARRTAGICIAAGLPTLTYLLTRSVLGFIPQRLRTPLEVALFSTTLSMRGLAESALSVERELENGDLGSARAQVGTFVGRDTVSLSESEVVRAAVESVAENTSDGVAAPMFYGVLFGAPGALAYKAINTLDSMIGYKHPPYTDLGHASARLDDFANFVPSRLTALTTAAASGHFKIALATTRRFAPLTASPNAGWPEAAFAGALGLRLGGTNTYGGTTHGGPTLGTGRPPTAGDARRAVALMRRTCALLAGLALLYAGLRRG